MSDKNRIGNLKMLKYNFMSSKKLNNLLKADLSLPPEQSDTDKIIYIATVVVRRKRRRGELPEKKPREELKQN